MSPKKEKYASFKLHKKLLCHLLKRRIAELIHINNPMPAEEADYAVVLDGIIEDVAYIRAAIHEAHLRYEQRKV